MLREFSDPTASARSAAQASPTLDIIARELSVTMGLCGVNTIAGIDEHILAV